MADMVTVNTRKTIGADTPAKPERGRGSRSMAPSPIQSTGPLLRERREAMGVTLAEAEVATRIRQKYLAALESDEWDLLPGEVVGRGFLRNYATYLGLEPTEMIERRRAVRSPAAGGSASSARSSCRGAGTSRAAHGSAKLGAEAGELRHQVARRAGAMDLEGAEHDDLAGERLQRRRVVGVEPAVGGELRRGFGVEHRGSFSKRG